MSGFGSTNSRGAYPPVDDLLGRTLNMRYQLTRCLSMGKLASVYRAHQLDGGEDVAIKVLRAGTSEAEHEMQKRFYREAKAASIIEHPNVIKIFETAETPDGLTYFVMELLEGMTLLELLRHTGPLPLRRVVEIFTPVCGALQAAHEVGVVHRDVKPGNVFLHHLKPEGDTEAGQECVKVLDFGIAKPERNENAIWESNISAEGTVVGTPEYMSPEQCQGQEVSLQSDIYSLGAMLYRMLVGQAPFDGPTASVLVRHVHSDPPPLRTRRPNLPQAIEDVVLQALAKKPAERYQSAVEFASAFAQAVDSNYKAGCDDLHRAVTPPEIEAKAIASQTLILRPVDLLKENQDLETLIPKDPK